MFLEFFKKEIFTALKRPMIYIFFFLVGLLVFGAVVSDNVQIGGSIGNIYKNAPTVVATFVSILNVFGLLFATAFFNNAALRDYKYGFNEILFSAPINKSGYYFGRFMGAWLLSTLVMTGIYFGVVVGTFVGPAMNWISPERVGPIPWKSFFSTYFIFTVPNMFIAGTIIFALAAKFKSTIISFVGTLLIIIGYIVALNLSSDIDNEGLAAIADMFGVRPYNLDIKYFTPVERNTISPSLTGYMLWNRLLWMGVGLSILALSYFTFSFQTKNKKIKKAKESTASSEQHFLKPTLSLAQTGNAWQHFWSFFKINFLSIFKNNIFVILLLFSIILLIANLSGGFEYFGLKSFPVTYKMIDQIGGVSSLFIFIILVFFSGELVWRDRDSHINEVIDGTPHNSVISLFAKTLSLIFLASIMHLTLIGISMLYQTIMGYTNFELGVYLTDFFYNGLLLYTILAGVLVAIQVFINQKYIGYFASILLLFAVDLVLVMLEVESSMLSFASTPSIRYSDMNGFGPGLLGKQWFSAYWILMAIVALLFAGLVWPRGTNSLLKNRFSIGKKTLGIGYTGTLGFFSLAWLAVTGFVYYNTQVLNPYKTSKEFELMQVDYEKKYKKYENTVSPKITDAVYHIDIFPKERDVKVVADVRLKNKSSELIDTIHFTINKDYHHEIVIPNASLSFADEASGFQSFALGKPMLPGDSLDIKINGAYLSNGFENNRPSTNVIENGTFFNNQSMMPAIGYSQNFEIGNKNKRRKYELPERKRMPELQDECSQLCMNNYLTDGTADWVNVETYISTSEDQVAIAPGSMVSKETVGGRNKYHYKVDHPSQNFYAFISARYEIAKRKWNGIDLEVYYHQGHERNVELMLDAIQKSLEYYTTNFGPYYHKQARIIEFPRYSNFAQAFPGTMPYSESFGFIIDLEEEEGEHKNNVIDAVIAHEMGHQYWAHQVIGANMQGSTMLSESFSEYSSLMVMKKETSPLDMKDFLKYDMNRYLRGRSSESDKEVPLHKVEDQGHIHYGKGAVILYALQNYIGEDKVNAALKGFLDEYAYKEPPYPTSNDFMRHLEPQVPDSLQYLIDDWFKSITLYDLRMDEAKATKTDNGKYSIDVDIIAKKMKADTIGNVEDVLVGDWVDIGFYSDSDEEDLMFSERVYIDQEEVSLTYQLDSLPKKAAIDPYRLLIDRVYKDNRKTVVEE